MKFGICNHYIFDKFVIVNNMASKSTLHEFSTRALAARSVEEREWLLLRATKQLVARRRGIKR